MSDLISRSRLLEEIKRYQMDIVSKATAIKVINWQPPVEAVQVVHGEWVNEYINRYGHPCHCCSVCGFHASHQDKNFCPECGADMRKKI